MTSADEAGRAQDQGRKHRRKAELSPETTSLLADWQVTLRHELRAIVEALAAKRSDGLGLIDETFAIPLDDPKRDRYVDRGVKVARELGTSIDATPAASEPVAWKPPRRRGRIDFGGA